MNMIDVLRKIIERLLWLLARLTLAKYAPRVVGVTGSVGKSSTKEAIALVLGREWRVRQNQGNYNNELGVPLTILGLASAGRNPWLWIGRFGLALWHLLVRDPKFPEILVLELGIDRPGDMQYLLSHLTPNFGVVTHISESHLAYFGTLGAIAKEKGRLIAGLTEAGTAILNGDDERVVKMGERTKAKVITYGLQGDVDVKGEHLKLLQEGGRIDGLSFKLSYGGTSLPVRLPETIGKHHVSPVLAAAAVGVAFKMNLVEIAEALMSFRPLPGRLTLLTGRQDMRILDDTYNASPLSTSAALAVLKEIIAPRRVVILGDMLEIGEGAVDAHRKLADAVIGSGATVFVGVGYYMRYLADALRGTSFPEKYIYSFQDPVLACESLANIVRTGDLVLVKGSQGLRMETIVESLLAYPEKDRDRLPRQSITWQAKPFIAPAEWPV